MTYKIFVESSCTLRVICVCFSNRFELDNLLVNLTDGLDAICEFLCGCWFCDCAGCDDDELLLRGVGGKGRFAFGAYIHHTFYEKKTNRPTIPKEF